MYLNPMKFRLFATIMAVLASAHTARAQAMFPPETDNAALRYWSALAEVQEPPDDEATRHLFGETTAGRVAWDETKLGPILDSNRDALRTVQQGTKLPVCNWIRLPERGADSPLVWYASGAAVSFECTPGNTRDGAWRFANGRRYLAGWGPLWAGCVTRRSSDCRADSSCIYSG